MQEQSQQSLESIAHEDPVARPLAILQLKALHASADPIWDRAAETLSRQPQDSGTPALQGQQIEIDAQEVSRLVNQLSNTLTSLGWLEAGQVPGVISDENAHALLNAAIEWDVDALAEIASEAGVDSAIIGTLGQCAALPLLLACGRRFSPNDSEPAWEPGYCPVCGSWPLLAEQRGLGRQQWLRCNRCAAAWQSRHQRCVYCDNTDHETLGYMAPEGERESRRVVTCENCKGYLKVFATVTPLGAADILRLDLQSLELDIAAVDAGYSRPERPGFSTEVELIPTQARIRRWLPWQ